MKNLNKFTIDTFKERIDKSYPGWDYTILSFNGAKDKMIIRCEKCLTEISFSKAELIFNRINYCKCYKKFKNFHEKIQFLSKEYDFSIIEEKKSNEKQVIKCNRCGLVMERNLLSILKTPWHCDNCNNYAKNRTIYTKEDVQIRMNEVFDSQYELLEYSGITKNALLKHKNCGMIFKITCLSDLFNGRNRGCPKCYQFKSVGEQRIRDFLELRQIKYIPQKTFAPLNKSKYRFDFFLPEYNMAIEYQGEQHYRDNHFFKDDLKNIQRRDEIKRKYCKENNIVLIEIKYTQLKHIQEILSSLFNDYRKL